jgi:hypothetical protein
LFLIAANGSIGQETTAFATATSAFVTLGQQKTAFAAAAYAILAFGPLTFLYVRKREGSLLVFVSLLISTLVGSIWLFGVWASVVGGVKSSDSAGALFACVLAIVHFCIIGLYISRRAGSRVLSATRPLMSLLVGDDPTPFAGWKPRTAATTLARVALIALAARAGVLALTPGHAYWRAIVDSSILTLDNGSDHTSALAFAPDGDKLVAGRTDGLIQIWDLKSGRALKAITSDGATVRSIAVTPDGRYAVSASRSNITVWDLATGRATRKLSSQSSVNTLTLHDDGKTVLAISDGSLTLWDLTTGTQLRTFDKGSKTHTAAATKTADGRTVLAFLAAGELLEEQSWDATTGITISHKTELATHGYITQVEIDPKGKRIVAATRFNAERTALRVIDLNSARDMWLDGHGQDVMALAISADGRMALSAGKGLTVRYWDLANGRHIARYRGHTKVITHVAFSPDGRYGASVSSGTIKIWDLAH